MKGARFVAASAMRARAVSDHTNPGAMRYLPQAVIATVAVAVMPVAVVWWLGSDGVISSSWLALAAALVLSLGAALVGSAYWKRRHGGVDLTFSELLLWGWLRRLWVERRLANATEMLDSLRQDELQGGANVEQRARALAQLAVAMELQDAYTIGHSRRVARHAAVIAGALDLPNEEAAKIRAAAAIHDIGKLHIPRVVLSKPDRLTDAEFELVKRHAALGAEMVSCLGDAELTAIVRHHHERIDGTGYPDGLAGEEIPLGARIVAVADTFDAIVSTRPYRPAAPHKLAIDVLREEAGTHLDARVVQAFLSEYSGRRALSIWAVLVAVPVAAVRALRGTRRPGSPGQRAAMATALAALAAAALAAPLATTQQPAHVPEPASSAVAASVQASSSPQASRPTSRAARPVSQRRVVQKARAVDSTCQAYNPQVCSALSAAEAAVGSPGGPSTPSASSSGGTLPFTGLDLGLIALLGVALLALGVLARRLARPR
jgi:HD domain